MTKSEVSQGLEVWVPSLQNSGIILSSHVNKNDEVQVQVGLVKMNFKLDELSSSNATNNMSRKNTNSKFDTLKQWKGNNCSSL